MRGGCPGWDRGTVVDSGGDLLGGAGGAVVEVGVIGMGFGDQLEAAVVGHGLGEGLRAGEAEDGVDFVDGSVVFVADEDGPGRDLVAGAVVGGGCGALEEDTPPRGGCLGLLVVEC